MTSICQISRLGSEEARDTLARYQTIFKFDLFELSRTDCYAVVSMLLLTTGSCVEFAWCLGSPSAGNFGAEGGSPRKLIRTQGHFHDAMSWKFR